MTNIGEKVTIDKIRKRILAGPPIQNYPKQPTMPWYQSTNCTFEMCSDAGRIICRNLDHHASDLTPFGTNRNSEVFGKKITTYHHIKVWTLFHHLSSVVYRAGPRYLRGPFSDCFLRTIRLGRFVWGKGLRVFMEMSSSETWNPCMRGTNSLYF